jgi:hypothetical protein
MNPVEDVLLGVGDCLGVVLLILIVFDGVHTGFAGLRRLLPHHVEPLHPRPPLPLPRMNELNWGEKVNVAFLDLDMALRELEARVHELEGRR